MPRVMAVTLYVTLVMSSQCHSQPICDVIDLRPTTTYGVLDCFVWTPRGQPDHWTSFLLQALTQATSSGKIMTSPSSVPISKALTKTLLGDNPLPTGYTDQQIIKTESLIWIIDSLNKNKKMDSLTEITDNLNQKPDNLNQKTDRLHQKTDNLKIARADIIQANKMLRAERNTIDPSFSVSLSVRRLLSFITETNGGILAAQNETFRGARNQMEPGADNEPVPGADSETVQGADSETVPGADSETERSVDNETGPRADNWTGLESDDEADLGADNQRDLTPYFNTTVNTIHQISTTVSTPYRNIRISMKWVASVVLDPVLGVLGVLGNLINCAVLKRSGFQKPANVFLFNLAIADVCVLLGSFDLFKFLIQFPDYTPLGSNYLEYACADQGFAELILRMSTTIVYISYSGMSISNCLCVVITIERLLAVFFPLKFAVILRSRCAWLVSVCLHVFWFCYFAMFFKLFLYIYISSPGAVTFIIYVTLNKKFRRILLRMLGWEKGRNIGSFCIGGSHSSFKFMKLPGLKRGMAWSRARNLKSERFRNDSGSQTRAQRKKKPTHNTRLCGEQ